MTGLGSIRFPFALRGFFSLCSWVRGGWRAQAQNAVGSIKNAHGNAVVFDGMTGQLCGLPKKLVKSHVIPDNMNRVLRDVLGDDPNAPMLIIDKRSGKTKRYPMGLYDKTISSRSMKVREIASLAEIDELETAIVSSAEATANTLRGLLERATAVQLLATLKFQKAGSDPLSDRPLNFIEQINQTFTYLASCEAVRYLLANHPARAPFTMHLGTAPGPDIVSADRMLIAEVFAATHPGSNDKLRNDLKKLRAARADTRYLFYSCPDDRRAIVPRSAPDVTIVPLGLWTGTLEGQ